MVAYISTDGISTPISDGKGNVWTALANHPAGFPQVCILSYCAKPVWVGPGHVFSCNANFQALFIAAFSGVGSFNIDTAFIDNYPVTIQPGPISAAKGDLLVTALGVFSPPAVLSIDSGFTITDQIAAASGANYGGGLAYLVAAAPGAVNPTWMLTSPAPGWDFSNDGGFFCGCAAVHGNGHMRGDYALYP